MAHNISTSTGAYTKSSEVMGRFCRATRVVSYRPYHIATGTCKRKRVCCITSSVAHDISTRRNSSITSGVSSSSYFDSERYSPATTRFPIVANISSSSSCFCFGQVRRFHFCWSATRINRRFPETTTTMVSVARSNDQWHIVCYSLTDISGPQTWSSGQDRIIHVELH